MPSDIRPPQDDRRLFEDPLERVRHWDSEADRHWVRACACVGPECDSAYLRAIYKAASYRRQAAIGERVPAF